MRQSNRRYINAVGMTAVIAVCGLIWATAVYAARDVSFSLDVLPILENHCVKCHNPDGPGYQASGLDLRGYESLMQGTKHGKVIVPGSPLTSNLMVLIEGRADRSIRMPHNEQPLIKQQIEIIRDWIKQGARDN